jgi:LysR family glycine cleavage system transcriptional activator
MPPLRALRIFEAAARLQSFSKAARELNVTPAAVSHQIRGLERHLGVELFRRTGRRVALSDDGRAAAESLRDGFEQIQRGVDALRRRSGVRTVTLNATPSFATRWLLPRLARFASRHPDLRLRVVTSVTPPDFEEDEIDLAIRLGRAGMEHARGEELFGERIAPVASPGFLRQHPVRRLVDLTRLPLLHDDSLRRAGRATGWTEWLRAAGGAGTHRRGGMQFNDGHLALQAAVEGLGVALGRMAYALPEIERGRLRRVHSLVLDLELGYWLLHSGLRSEDPAVVAVAEWLRLEALRFRRELAALV